MSDLEFVVTDLLRSRIDATYRYDSVTPPDVHRSDLELKSALERNRVIEINPAPGTKFDPHQHQAISVIPADQEANTVVAVLQKGYLIADRILRPALVTVAAPR